MSSNDATAAAGLPEVKASKPTTGRRAAAAVAQDASSQAQSGQEARLASPDSVASPRQVAIKSAQAFIEAATAMGHTSRHATCEPPPRQDNSMFDAQLKFVDWFQKTQGVIKLGKAMDAANVHSSVLSGVGLCKKWEKDEKHMPEGVFACNGRLYYYSGTDDFVRNSVYKHPDMSPRFFPLLAGFNPTDKFADELLTIKEGGPGNGSFWCGLGEVYFRSADISNLTNEEQAHLNHQSAFQVMGFAKQRKFPVLFNNNAGNVGTKPYRKHYEYVEEVAQAAAAHPDVNFVWGRTGMFERGDWGLDYIDEVKKILTAHKNVFCTITPKVVTQYVNLLDKEKGRAALIALVNEFPDRFMLGTNCFGRWDDYAERVATLRSFVAELKEEGRKAVLFDNAARVFHRKREQPLKVRDAIKVHKKEEELKVDPADIEAFPGQKSAKDSKEFATIDCHLHLLDFLQKSEGTPAILEAMDLAKVNKAVLFGMPCCKKWCAHEACAPLYYQDDNGPLYFYSYADQMVADAWLALSTENRKRFAPCMGAFDPTDLHADKHLRRMYAKYPKLWRGVGEVMCRHDDLTTLLGGETPAANTPGMMKVYEFCVEVGLPVLVHHNSDRVGDNDDTWQYVSEVEEVLRKFPTLRFVWVHCGVSRRIEEPLHYQMIDRMLSTYDNLNVDISWVVWEDVICNKDNQIKKKWVEVIQKHHTKVMIGSDNVAIYSEGKLKGNIAKYWPLFEVLSEEAAKNVAYANAEKLYFDNWGGPDTYPKQDPCYPCEQIQNDGTFKILGKY